MAGGEKKKAPRRLRTGWLVLPMGLALLVVAAAGGGAAYAAHLENNDAFCASCHSEPEAKYFSQSQTPPVDLASAHAAQGVECIQCHSGAGTIGRVTAMTSVALPDLIAYQSGHYAKPAITTKPMGDDHCLKCHPDVGQSSDFNNHFHAILPEWQAQDPRNAATCEECHVSHVAGGNPQIGYLVESTTASVCQRCHAFAG
jgi:predicted CXXCH cytochrome family protein